MYKLYFILIGYLVTIKRSVKQNHDTGSAHHQRLAQVEKNQDIMMESIGRMEKTLENISFHVAMDTESIDHIFPINDTEAVDQFMSNGDGRFARRKRELEKLIFSVWSPNITKRQFSDSLINVLFTRSYIASHRWPHLG